MSAILGMVLMPVGFLLASLWRVMSSVLLSVTDLRIIIANFLHRILPGQTLMVPLLLSHLLTPVFASFMAVGALAITVAQGIAVSLIVMYEGGVIGWNEGVTGLWNNIYDVFQTGSSIFTPQELDEHFYPGLELNGDLDVSNAESEAAYLEEVRQFQGESHYQLVLQQFRQSGVVRNLQPMSEEYYASMKLTVPEQRQLIRNSPTPLTVEEIRILLNAGDKGIKEHVEHYKVLQMLATEKCAILQDRPENKQDTILLVKQYQKDRVWLPVPLGTHVFDKDSLKQWLLEHAVHPLTRDKMTQPSDYEADNVLYPARYIVHDYYLDKSYPHGFSQEMADLTATLRTSLAVMSPQILVESSQLGSAPNL